MLDKKTRQLELEKSEESKNRKLKISEKKKKQKDEGNRWTALVLLVMTIVAGLLFYFQGAGGISWLSLKLKGLMSNDISNNTFVLE